MEGVRLCLDRAADARDRDLKGRLDGEETP